MAGIFFPSSPHLVRAQLQRQRRTRAKESATLRDMVIAHDHPQADHHHAGMIELQKVDLARQTVPQTLWPPSSRSGKLTWRDHPRAPYRRWGAAHDELGLRRLPWQMRHDDPGI